MSHIKTAYDYGCQQAVRSFQKKYAGVLGDKVIGAADWALANPEYSLPIAGGAAGAVGGAGVGALAAGQGKRGKGALIGGGIGGLTGAGLGAGAGQYVGGAIDKVTGDPALHARFLEEVTSGPDAIPSEELAEIREYLPRWSERLGIQ